MSTKIEWTEETWNPVVGCSKVSDGCKNCYAIVMANRLAHIHTTADLYMDTVTVGASGRPNWTGVVKVSEGAMDKPLHTKKPTMFFVNSMSDLFHESLSFEIIDSVYQVMAACPQHTFQVLTKRPERMQHFYEWKAWGGGAEYHYNNLQNVWVGVSVENQKTADERIPLLLQVPAAVRFLSCEPLLGKVNLNLMGAPPKELGYNYLPIRNLLHWVIVGGESGTGSRPMHPDWVRYLRDQCGLYDVPFFFKQWGDWVAVDMPHAQEEVKKLEKNEQWLNLAGGMGFHGEQVYRMRRVGKAKAGKKLDGVSYNEFPPSKRIIF